MGTRIKPSYDSLSIPGKMYMDSIEDVYFCTGCPEVYCMPATEINPGYCGCPCNFEISSPDCARSKLWDEIIEALAEIEDIWREHGE